MDRQELIDVTEIICDKYCKFPVEAPDDNTLEDICNKCPLALLADGKHMEGYCPWQE